MEHGDAIKVYRAIKERGYVIPILEADGELSASPSNTTLPAASVE
jgi:hypothetical protein